MSVQVSNKLRKRRARARGYYENKWDDDANIPYYQRNFRIGDYNKLERDYYDMPKSEVLPWRKKVTVVTKGEEYRFINLQHDISWQFHKLYPESELIESTVSCDMIIIWPKLKYDNTCETIKICTDFLTNQWMNIVPDVQPDDENIPYILTSDVKVKRFSEDHEEMEMVVGIGVNRRDTGCRLCSNYIYSRVEQGYNEIYDFTHKHRMIIKGAYKIDFVIAAAYYRFK